MFRRHFAHSHRAVQQHKQRNRMPESTTPKPSEQPANVSIATSTQQPKKNAPLITPVRSSMMMIYAGIPSVETNTTKKIHTAVPKPEHGKISDLGHGIFKRISLSLPSHKHEINLLKNKIDVIYDTSYRRSNERAEYRRQATFKTDHLKQNTKKAQNHHRSEFKIATAPPRRPARFFNNQLQTIREEDLTKLKLGRRHSK